MKLTYKAIARMAGYRVTNAGDIGWFWINLDTEHKAPEYGNGKIIYKERDDAWKAACTDNGLIEEE